MVDVHGFGLGIARCLIRVEFLLLPQQQHQEQQALPIQTAAVLQVDIISRPHIVNRTMHTWQPERQNFKHVFRLPVGGRGWVVRCTNQDVVCDHSQPHQPFQSFAVVVALLLLFDIGIR